MGRGCGKTAIRERHQVVLGAAARRGRVWIIHVPNIVMEVL